MTIYDMIDTIAKNHAEKKSCQMYSDLITTMTNGRNATFDNPFGTVTRAELEVADQYKVLVKDSEYKNAYDKILQGLHKLMQGYLDDVA